MAAIQKVTKTVVKKRTKPFRRFQSDRFKRLDASWRKPKGIDNRVRRRYRGTMEMPSIGYGAEKATKDVLPCGYRKFLVSRVEDLNMLLCQKDSLCAEINHSVSGKSRLAIIKRANELNIYVTNKKARIHSVEAQ